MSREEKRYMTRGLNKIMRKLYPESFQEKIRKRNKNIAKDYWEERRQHATSSD